MPPPTEDFEQLPFTKAFRAACLNFFEPLFTQDGRAIRPDPTDIPVMLSKIDDIIMASARVIPNFGNYVMQDIVRHVSLAAGLLRLVGQEGEDDEDVLYHASGHIGEAREKYDALHFNDSKGNWIDPEDVAEVNEIDQKSTGPVRTVLLETQSDQPELYVSEFFDWETKISIDKQYEIAQKIFSGSNFSVSIQDGLLHLGGHKGAGFFLAYQEGWYVALGIYDSVRFRERSFKEIVIKSYTIFTKWELWEKFEPISKQMIQEWKKKQ